MCRRRRLNRGDVVEVNRGTALRLLQRMRESAACISDCGVRCHARTHPARAPHLLVVCIEKLQVLQATTGVGALQASHANAAHDHPLHHHHHLHRLIVERLGLVNGCTRVPPALPRAVEGQIRDLLEPPRRSRWAAISIRLSELSRVLSTKGRHSRWEIGNRLGWLIAVAPAALSPVHADAHLLLQRLPGLKRGALVIVIAGEEGDARNRLARKL